MLDLTLHYVKAKDIGCFGEIELHFDDFGKVVQIAGENLDVPPCEDGKPASNGAGKSSIQDLISIGLYGKTVKKPKEIKGAELIRDGEEEGTVEICWNDCRVIRAYKRKGSNKIEMWRCKDHIWDEKTKIKGGITETNAEIIKSLKMTHEAFCNVVVFDDSRDYDFLESDADDKRKIVENLLGLEKYRLYSETAKNKLKAVKVVVSELTRDYERLSLDHDSCADRISKLQKKRDEWRVTKEEEMKRAYLRFKTLQKQLESTDVGSAMKQYDDAKTRLSELEAAHERDEAQKKKIEGIIQELQTKVSAFKEQRDEVKIELQEYLVSMKSAETQLVEITKALQKLERLEEGATCSVCHATISKQNYGHVLSHERNSAEGLRSKIEKSKLIVDQETTKFGQKSALVSKAEEKIGEAQKSLSVVVNTIRQRVQEIRKLSEIQMPETDTATLVLEKEISELKRRLGEMKAELDGNSPYEELLCDAEDELKEKQQKRDSKDADVKAADGEIPYYEFWVKAFGDKGIRKYIIDGIIPSLNERISHWLHHLIDGALELTFDNQLDAKVVRHGQDTKYSKLSNGEKQRINLAISQSFAYIMMLNSGTMPSIVFLDEVTGGGIDRAGTLPVYNMLCELAKDRQVFVTTHNENLLSLLDGCERILVRKHGKVTIVAS